MAGDNPPKGVSVFSQALKALAVPRLVGKDGGLSLDSPAMDKKKKQSRNRQGMHSKSKEKGVDSVPPPQSFWAYMDDYFREVTAEDVLMIHPMSDSDLNRALSIPPLGVPYRQQWALVDMAEQAREAKARALVTEARVKRKLLRASPINKKPKIGPSVHSGPLLVTVISPSVNEDETEICHVCAGGESIENNRILFCDSCDVAVHQECYGIPVVPDGNWLCARCSSSTPNSIHCCLCSIKGGALKPVSSTPCNNQELHQYSLQPEPIDQEFRKSKTNPAVMQHAHLFCCQWIPETFIGNIDNMEPICNVGGICKERLKLTCSLCKQKCGACIQCAHGLCAVAFHPMCAREEGLLMQVSSREGSDQVNLQAFCAKHSNARVGRELHFMSGSAETSIGEDKREQAPASMAAVPEDEIKTEPMVEVSLTSGSGSGSGPQSESVLKPEPGDMSQFPAGSSAMETFSITEDSAFGVKSMIQMPLDCGGLMVLPFDKHVAARDANPADALALDACTTLQLIGLIKQLMIVTQTTQTSIASMASISQSMLSTWLQGKERPSQESLNTRVRSFLRGKVVKNSPELVRLMAERQASGQLSMLEDPSRNIHLSTSDGGVSHGQPPSLQSQGSGALSNGFLNMSANWHGLMGTGSEERVEPALESVPPMGHLVDIPVPWGSVHPYVMHLLDRGSLGCPNPLTNPTEFKYESSKYSEAGHVVPRRIIAVGKRVSRPIGEGRKNGRLAEPKAESKATEKQGEERVSSGVDVMQASGLQAQLEGLKKLGLEAMAPDDDLEAEILLLQSQLIRVTRSNRDRAESVMENVVKDLRSQQITMMKRQEDGAAITKYLAEQRELKKKGRKDRKDKEARLQLAELETTTLRSSRSTTLPRRDSTRSGQDMSSPVSATPKASLRSSASALESPVGTGRSTRPRTQSRMGSTPKSQPSPISLSLPASIRRLQEGNVSGSLSLNGSPEDPCPFDDIPGTREDESDALCAVCNYGDSDAPNVIVFCDRCGVAVHQQCYGVDEIPSGSWFCQPCLMQRQKAAADNRALPLALPDMGGHLRPGVRCYLCPGQVGAFKCSSSGLWTHVSCAQWMAESRVDKSEGGYVWGLDLIPREKFNLICLICKQKNGACLTCNFGHCSSTMHLSCARNTGLLMTAKSAPGGRVQIRVYCDRHTPMQQAKESKHRMSQEEGTRLKKMRAGLEKLRLLCDSTVKREKTKRDLVACLHDHRVHQLAQLRQMDSPVPQIERASMSAAQRSAVDSSRAHPESEGPRQQVSLTPLEAYLKNQRLPKGYILVPVAQAPYMQFIKQEVSRAAAGVESLHLEAMQDDAKPQSAQ